ncbi:RecX family transcriptional regulator [Candidatus Comchoanobacter bicostacola]|uniref:RecX family transcriptional regulator n=1 Tax=Candidatus Comchoanobacter bicostacola TaxID=2919598 RepID=A0ABY5DJJ8_9GAMM|nr:RecX family transcriptional regulator [Candidatus Comchoanobacter bicostacola]UTC24188.1 RecX family transcriptional regulator [Candidatus Comchoanobacter bicostacola]
MQSKASDLLRAMLERREYSAYEAVSVLKSKGVDAQMSLAAVADFKAKGWLCDLRFVEAKVTSLIQRGYGLYYVKQVLSGHNITADLSDYDWAYARSVALRKAGKRTGLALRQFLFRRGFQS